ncbi:MAG TPA: metal ABC transporter permease, partial [Terriglobales bacterium]
INPIVGAASTLFIGTLLVWGLERRTGIATEAAIGVVFAASLAVGALLTPKEDLEQALFGQLQSLTLAGFIVASAVTIAIIAIVFLRKQHLILALFSRDMAATAGVRVDRLDLEFLLLFSLTILVSLKFLGALLAGALLMIPAATGRRLATGIDTFLQYSVGTSLAAVVVGLFISSNTNFGASAGPVIVLVATVIFVLASVIGPTVLRRKP